MLVLFQINWQNYFNVAMNQVNKTITANEHVVVYGPDYLSNLTQIINEYTNDDEGKTYDAHSQSAN